MRTVSNPVLQAGAFGKAPALAIVAAVLGIIACVAGYFMGRPADPHGYNPFFHSYLVGYMFWMNFTLGGLFLLMVQHLSGGHWGVVSRRIFEAASKNIWLMAILFLPILGGLGSLYEWTHMSNPEVANDPVLSAKRLWLNVPSFYARLVIFFGVIGLIIWFLTSWSARQDRTADPRIPTKFRGLSGPGVVIFFMLVTFAAMDWLLSLEPHYYSTMYGPVIMVGQALGMMAFTIVTLILLSQKEPMSNVLTLGHLHDLGKLMFGFTMFWAYINFSQFLIIWAGNVPEETQYYARRTHGGWGYVAWSLIFLQFVAPFSILLSREIKRKPKALIWIALFILVMRFVDLSFLILPSAAVMQHAADAAHGAHDTLTSHFDWAAVGLAFGSVLAVGGIWLLSFFRNLSRRPIIPVNDPYLQEALDFHGGH